MSNFIQEYSNKIVLAVAKAAGTPDEEIESLMKDPEYIKHRKIIDDVLVNMCNELINIPQTQWGNAVSQVKADIDHFRHEQRTKAGIVTSERESK